MLTLSAEVVTAYRELGVIEIREILKYVTVALAAGLQRGDAEPSDAHIATVLATVRANAGGRPGAVPDRLAPHRAQITPCGSSSSRISRRAKSGGRR